MGISDKKIVIYSAANAHGYITCVGHRLLYSADKYAVYIGDDVVATRAGGINLFDDSILFKQIAGEWGNMNYLSPDEYEDYLIKTFDEHLKKLKINLEEVNEFFIGSNWSDFAIYLNLKNQNYNIFEEGIGDIGLPKESWGIKYPCQFEARKKTGMFNGLDNPHIIKAYVHPKTVKDGHSKVVPFDIVKEMQNLSEKHKKIIAKQFNVPISLTNNITKVLVLTQWFRRNGGVWNSDETIKLYTLLIDAFFYDKPIELIIKPHPVDPKRDEYTNYFENCALLSSKFPSEFMGLINGLHVDTAITVSSTSINGVDSISDKQISVKFFDNFYSIIPEVFICARLIKLLNYNLFNFGLFSEVLSPLLESNKGFLPDATKWFRIDEKPLTEKGAFILYDYVWREGVTHTSLTILSQSAFGSIFFIIADDICNLIKTYDDFLLLDYLYCFNVSVRPYSNNSAYKDKHISSVYLFSMDKTAIDRISDMAVTLLFKNSKVIIEKGGAEKIDSNSLKLNYLLKKLSTKEKQ